MSSINTCLRDADKPVLKRRDFRWYSAFDQEFTDGTALVEVLATRKEMYLVIGRDVVGWAEFNPTAVEVCQEDPRLYERIFHLFDKGQGAQLEPPGTKASVAA